MHNEQLPTFHQKSSFDKLNTNSPNTDKENISQAFKSIMNNNILNDLIHNEVPGQYSNRSRKSNNEPNSDTKGFQSGLRDLTDYIFAENNSSIYYTENLDEPRSASGFDSGTKIDPASEVKEFATETSKSVTSSYVSEPRSLGNSSRINTTAGKYKTGDIDVSIDKSILLSEKDLLSNGVIIDEVLLHEGKPFIVMSVKNDIPCQRRNELSNTTYTDNTSWTSVSKRRGDSLILSQCQEEIKKADIQILGMRGLKNEVSDFVSSISQHLPAEEQNTLKEENKNEEEKYKEHFKFSGNNSGIVLRNKETKNPLEDDNRPNDLFRKKIYSSIGNTEEDDDYQKKKEELAILNRRILEETADLEENMEGSQYQPLFKKTLSIIFSTNESIETSSHRESLANLSVQSSTKALETLPNNNIGKDFLRHLELRQAEEISEHKTLMNQVGNNYNNTPQESATSSNLRSEQESFEGKSEYTIDINGEDFLSLLSMIEYQHKDNKPLSGGLSKLRELYNKQVNKYEEDINALNEKVKKYGLGNDLLIKTLKTFEKELDKLAINNQTLHTNILYLQEEIKEYENREKNHKNLLAQQDAAFDNIKEELKAKIQELEDTKRKLSVSNSKVESLSLYAQSCEDSLNFVSQTLKQSLNQKQGKITSKYVFSVLETIYTGISKFGDRVDTKIRIEDSRSSISSRKNSDLSRSDDNIHPVILEPSSSRKDTSFKSSARQDKDQRNTKSMSKSIDLTSVYKLLLSKNTIPTRAVTNRHRLHSFGEKDELEKIEEKVRSISARGRTNGRNKSQEKFSPRLDKSAPQKSSNLKQGYKPAKKHGKVLLESNVEESLRKRLIENLKTK